MSSYVAMGVMFLIKTSAVSSLSIRPVKTPSEMSVSNEERLFRGNGANRNGVFVCKSDSATSEDAEIVPESNDNATSVRSKHHTESSESPKNAARIFLDDYANLNLPNDEAEKVEAEYKWSVVGIKEDSDNKNMNGFANDYEQLNNAEVINTHASTDAPKIRILNVIISAISLDERQEIVNKNYTLIDK